MLASWKKLDKLSEVDVRKIEKIPHKRPYFEI